MSSYACVVSTSSTELLPSPLFPVSNGTSEGSCLKHLHNFTQFSQKTKQLSSQQLRKFCFSKKRVYLRSIYSFYYYSLIQAVPQSLGLCRLGRSIPDFCVLCPQQERQQAMHREDVVRVDSCQIPRQVRVIQLFPDSRNILSQRGGRSSEDSRAQEKVKDSVLPNSFL